MSRIGLCLLLAVGLVALASPALTRAGDAVQPSQVEPTNKSITSFGALIPFKAAHAFEKSKQFSSLVGRAKSQMPKAFTNGLDKIGQIAYVVPCEVGTIFVTSTWGDVEVMRKELFNQQGQPPSATPSVSPALSPMQAVTLVRVAAKRWFPQPQRLNAFLASDFELRVWAASEPGDTNWLGVLNPPGLKPEELRVTLFEVLPSGVWGVNRVRATVDARNGKMLEYEQSFRPAAQSTVPRVTRQDAIAIARYCLAGGEPLRVELKLSSDFSPEQLRQLTESTGPRARGRGARCEVEEDPWLHQRLVWKLDFNYGTASIDATTGRVLNCESSVPFDSRAIPSPLPQPEVVPRPAAFVDPAPPVDQPDEVITNGFSIGVNRLHFPPIIRDGQPLICAEYLPAFLIKLTRQGQVIYARGLLPKEGKTARLTLGSKHARISGQELELEAAPVEVEGRLYVPASLLQRVNGVLVRWEAKSKTLWVDTRYLRRP